MRVLENRVEEPKLQFRCPHCSSLLELDPDDIRDGQGHGRHPSWHFRCAPCGKTVDLPGDAIPAYFYKKLDPTGC